MGYENDYGPTVKEIDPLIGTTVGNYLVERELAHGGMGVVYAAKHPDIGRKVAIKVVFNRFAANSAMVQRFKAEALSVNKIGHPNIIDISDFGMLPDGRPYFVMEILNGEDLGQRLNRVGTLSYEQAAPILRQTLDALEAAHAANIVHRDLKPDNIYLHKKRGVEMVKLLDFGIAKLRDQSPGIGATADGTLMGTPLYMSPEQAMGAQSKIGPASDIYAVGVILFQMFTGVTPFVGESFGELLLKHMQETPPPPSSKVPGMDPHLEHAILKCLEKDPDRRFSSVTELIEALVQVIPQMAHAQTSPADSMAAMEDSGKIKLPPPRPADFPMTQAAPGLAAPSPTGAARSATPEVAGQLAAPSVTAPPARAGLKIAAAALVGLAIAVAGGFFFARGPKPLPAVEVAPPPLPGPMLEGHELSSTK